MPRRHRNMKGGFLDSIGTSLSELGTSISQGASSAWEKTKNATSSAYNSVTGTSSSFTGGSKRTRRRKGGYSALLNYAENAAPVRGINNAQSAWIAGGYAQPEWLSSSSNSNLSYTGGKTRKRRHSKSKKHRKSRRY